MVGGPLMMVFETFPVIRKLDFLLGNHFARLQAMLNDANAMVEDVRFRFNMNLVGHSRE